MKLQNKFLIDDRERESRKKYLRITDADTDRLRELLPTVEKHVDDIVEQFYRHLFEFPQARSFFNEAAVLARTKAAQREYLLDLFRGDYDDAYFERRLQIGVVHERIGLPAKWYIGSNSTFLQLLIPLISKRYRFRPWKVTQTILSLTKVINLDEQLVMDTYIGSMVEKLQGLSERIINTVEILAPSAQESAAKAEITAMSAGAALEVAQEGINTLDRSLEAMAKLKEKAEGVIEQISQLDQLVAKIEEMARIVSNLTTETNMLALNAEVQAARAGERGKGFGVVAEEIRKLADQSQRSLERIYVLVGQIRNASDSTVRASNDNTGTVEEGIQLAHSMGEAFNRLVNSSRDAFASVQNISMKANEQAQKLLELQSLVEGRAATKA